MTRKCKNGRCTFVKEDQTPSKPANQPQVTVTSTPINPGTNSRGPAQRWNNGTSPVGPGKPPSPGGNPGKPTGPQQPQDPYADLKKVNWKAVENNFQKFHKLLNSKSLVRFTKRAREEAKKGNWPGVRAIYDALGGKEGIDKSSTSQGVQEIQFGLPNGIKGKDVQKYIDTIVKNPTQVVTTNPAPQAPTGSQTTELQQSQNQLNQLQQQQQQGYSVNDFLSMINAGQQTAGGLGAAWPSINNPGQQQQGLGGQQQSNFGGQGQQNFGGNQQGPQNNDSLKSIDLTKLDKAIRNNPKEAKHLVRFVKDLSVAKGANNWDHFRKIIDAMGGEQAVIDAYSKPGGLQNLMNSNPGLKTPEGVKKILEASGAYVTGNDKNPKGAFGPADIYTYNKFVPWQQGLLQRQGQQGEAAQSLEGNEAQIIQGYNQRLGQIGQRFVGSGQNKIGSGNELYRLAQNNRSLAETLSALRSNQSNNQINRALTPQTESLRTNPPESIIKQLAPAIGQGVDLASKIALAAA